MNFKFYKNYGNKEFYEKIITVEENINSKKYPFPVEIRKLLELFIDYEFSNVENIKTVGSKIKYIVDNKQASISITNKISKLNEIVKPFAHSGSDFSDVKFDQKKDMLNKMHEIITDYKEVYDEEFKESFYTDENKMYFEKKYSKKYFQQLLDEKELKDSECFELFSSKYLMKLDELEYEQRVVGGKNDGGINIFFIDDENYSINIAQCRYVSSITKEDIESSIDKIINTINCFNENRYNDKKDEIKSIGSNWLNYLEENNSISVSFITSAKIEFEISTILSKYKKQIQKKLGNEIKVNFSIICEKEIEEILKNDALKAGVKECKLELVDKDSYIEIKTENYSDVLLAVITGESLRKVYESQSREGQIFEKNVRGYIKNGKIDSGIKNTLKDNPEKFLILNNGLTIIAKNINRDGRHLKFDELFIVNGGQTTSLIGDSSINSSIKEVKVFVKIIDNSNENIIEEISEASNNQKPIKPIDLIANNRNVKKFHDLINSKKSKYRLIYKRADRLNQEAKRMNKKIVKTEDLMKLYFSFIEQKPGTARSGFKNQITKDNSDVIFRKFNSTKGNGYDFFLDLMYLEEIYEHNFKKWKTSNDKDELNKGKDLNEFEFLKNGKNATVALIGAMVYYITCFNKNVKPNIESYQNQRSKILLSSFIKKSEFENKSDKDDKFITLINLIAQESASVIKNSGMITTNFLKTDANYSKLFDEIILNFGSRNVTLVEQNCKELLTGMKFKK
ncbi:AIPR family protein [Spiroplasma endosymbiont of Dioctria linearis]|uniref:AIPR family protein n=1 Tax=Spiroplasma endosymbiont of Dioctria linearis TaxID=3066290 RepID=UPI00313B2A18